ncbi:MAG: hypothetical protein RLZZ337_1577 [Bacteroidota bacterium]
MIQNPSPRHIAGLSSLLVALFSSVVVYFFTDDVASIFLNLVVTFLSSYLLFNYLLKQFIYRKIKLIYKNIHRFKTQSSSVTQVLENHNQDPIEEVSKEVMDWMKENRREINQLKEQASYRREFLGNVSHELKTPIQSIQGYIHTLLDGALEDKKVNRVFLNKASKGVDRLVELVEDLTSIAEFESNAVNLDFQKFDIVVLINEVFEIVEQQALNKNVSLKIKKQSPKSYMVWADRNKIRQVLINLIVNAIKYGKKKGFVLIGLYDMDKNLLLEVADDGEGIAKEHLPRLFERFYRTDKGRSRNEGGSGLGLSIAKHIMEAHRQTINVRSTVGEGSTFGITLKKA